LSLHAVNPLQASGLRTSSRPGVRENLSGPPAWRPCRSDVRQDSTPGEGRRYRATPAVGHPFGRPRWMTEQRTRRRRQASTASATAACEELAALGVVDGVVLIGSALAGDVSPSRTCPRSGAVLRPKILESY
jgi:hypothetical protein